VIKRIIRASRRRGACRGRKHRSTANGKWRARYRDETGHEHTRHFDRKVDAQQWLDQVTAAVVTGTYADPKSGQITFAAFYGEWSARQVWAPGTVLAMSLAARSVPFAAKPMRQVRRSDVEEVWIKSMDAAGLAPGTIKTRYVNVRSVFRAAVRDRVIGTDPTDTVRLPRRRRADAAMSIPTPADVGLLMTAAEDGFRTFVALCAFAGLRLGEAAAVQLGDVDFVGAALAVTRQVQRVNGGAIDVRAPKYGSERVVPWPTAWSISSPSTSQTSARSATRSGCSPARVTSRPTKTLSATGGARRCGSPA
jgi:integrase